MRYTSAFRYRGVACEIAMAGRELLALGGIVCRGRASTRVIRAGIGPGIK